MMKTLTAPAAPRRRRLRLRFAPLTALIRWNEAYRCQRQLESLDDRMLRDIGLSKAERDISFLRRHNIRPHL
ncbi:MAG: hypothetical protein CL814_03520 [Confluentimicrobium sp.]|nr:hypothetical protein [Actibacterium sp.]|tara:strand:+ start:2556 stop:2771 length:216 start_codon:yes stop_codon:yes gene_type:complete